MIDRPRWIGEWEFVGRRNKASKIRGTERHVVRSVQGGEGGNATLTGIIPSSPANMWRGTSSVHRGRTFFFRSRCPRSVLPCPRDERRAGRSSRRRGYLVSVVFPCAADSLTPIARKLSRPESQRGLPLRMGHDPVWFTSHRTLGTLVPSLSLSLKDYHRAHRCEDQLGRDARLFAPSCLIASIDISRTGLDMASRTT